MANEEIPVTVEEVPIGKVLLRDMTVDDFFAVGMKVALHAVATHAQAEAAKGDTKLMNMGIERFTEAMMGVLKGRSMRSAVGEAEVSRRILSDWQGLQDVEAITQPFRITSVADVDKFADDLRESFKHMGSRLVLTVAVAVVAGDDLYQPFPRR